ncbi:F-type H+-transporting ATPase subunit epsilon [Rhodoligotrophos appendicifer]|uniref:F0F1 ATP synthase subunit epsilon n=1 Tax=Rhodoligotrophos appendicifer TaxID=987056 RepID=UPI00117CD428|nr:F0F1 ATP synthase subunit epsilon [Rhodoligotrophos appendicifer]
MAELLHFELVSPERLLFSGEVAEVTVPGSEGEFTVLVRHAPLVATLKPGLLVIRKESGAPEKIFLRGGFAEINPRGLTVLAEEAIPLAELDRAAFEVQFKNAAEDVADAKDDEKRRRAQEVLDHLRQLQAALSAPV